MKSPVFRFTVLALASSFSLTASLAHARGRTQAKAQPDDASTASPAPTTKPDESAPAPTTATPTTPSTPPSTATTTIDLDAPRERPAEAEAKDEKAPAAENKETISLSRFELNPYLQVAGGLKIDSVIDKKGADHDGRFVTFAVSRFGILGQWGGIVTVQSELMANGGIGLHGTSVYEGQAALQVRQQMIRLTYAPVTIDVGRIVDDASLDYFSAHVRDTLVQDTATRDPLLYSGFNLGNGIRGAVEVVPKLTLGLTVNAGNPVSTTSTLSVGGTFPPFERIYTQAYQAVNQGPNHFPDDTFHVVVVTPSVIYDGPEFGIKVAAQGFDVNTNTTKAGDDHVRGYNLRATARAKLLRGLVVPFASAAYTRNDTLDPNNLEKRSHDRYQAINLGGGIDLNIARRFKGFEDSADGFGVQYQQVQFQVGDGLVTTFRYVNVGASYWLTPHVAIGARAALWVEHQNGTDDVGERNFILGLRASVP